MKQPRPLPTEQPLITFYTPTYLRPQALARNMASVGRQTAVERVEQIVLPDHVGHGLADGLYGRIRWYADACRGRYVTVLADDDVLAAETLVMQFAKFIEKTKEPAVVLTRVTKGGVEFPKPSLHIAAGIEPVEGDVDLGSYILRRDVWLRHAADYGLRYQGDYDHAHVLWNAGYSIVPFDVLWAEGPASSGREEGTL